MVRVGVGVAVVDDYGTLVFCMTLFTLLQMALFPAAGLEWKRWR